MTESVIDCQNITFSYGNNLVLNNITASFKQGHIYCLLGVNGSGKTTLLNCLAGLSTIQSGHISAFGKDISSLNTIERAKLLAYVPQLQSSPHSYTVKDYVSFGRNPYVGLLSSPKKADFLLVEKYLNDCGIYDLKERPIDELSGGQLQLVLIAKALVQETPIIFMDEPMSALDLSNQSLILKKLIELKKEGKTIVISTHDPNQALALNDFVGFLQKQGSFSFGPIDEVFTQENIKEAYDGQVELTETISGKRVCVFSTEKENKLDFL